MHASPTALVGQDPVASSADTRVDHGSIATPTAWSCRLYFSMLEDQAPHAAVDGSPLDAANSDPAQSVKAAPTGFSSAEIGALYHASCRRLRGAVRQRIGNADEAADIVQDAFARFLQAKPSSGIRSPGAYLRRIVQNLVNDRSKRAEQRLVVRSEFPSDANCPSVPAQQEWQLEAADLMNAYRAAVQALPDRTRQVFLLHRVDELRYRDIALRLGISVATVEYHMMRALSHLDHMLDR